MNALRILTTAGGHRLRLRRGTNAEGDRSAQRGQVLAIFAIMAVVLLGGAALVTDVTLWWTVEQRMQRAADAAALAGARFLPEAPGTAFAAAYAEAERNGFKNGSMIGSGVVTVSPRPDPRNIRKLIVHIDGGADTNFARVFGLPRVAIGVTGAAEFVLPVPMGSPQNYYGVFGTLRGATYTETLVNPPPRDTDWKVAMAAPNGGGWTFTSGSITITDAIKSDNNEYAYETTNSDVQQWRDFGLVLPPPGANQSLKITGVEVRLQDAFVSGACPSSRIGVNLSWNGGSSWTSPATPVRTPELGTDASAGDYTLGSNVDPTVWGTHTWVGNEFSDTNFRVRLTAIKGCATAATRLNLDMLEVRISYQIRWVNPERMTLSSEPLKGPGTPCDNKAEDCYDPDGSALDDPQKFWATMNTRGASNLNGDAHQPYYDTAPFWNDPASGTVAPKCSDVGSTRACHDASQHYNYAIEMPPNSTDGYVYVFDPAFCATGTNKGTGDRWFDSDWRRPDDSTLPISSWYELYVDADRTPYDLGDDDLVASSGSLFTNMNAADPTMGGDSSYGADCRKRDTAYGDGRDYHISWYLLNPDDPMTGGSKGTIYRVHTTGTDPSGTIKSTANGEQSFALYVSATTSASGPGPRIYGYGAMQMFTPLCAGGYDGCPVSSTTPPPSEFYLAQIEDVHAGKTVEIQLWDPGDTCSDPGRNCLAANVQILIPTSSGWTVTPLDYTAQVGTSASGVNTACNANKGTGVSSITTAVSSSSLGRFNGCWLTIQIPIDEKYTAPQEGWWKIRYNMTGTGTSNDVTTWKVSILGNPVHLVPVGG